MHSFECHHPVDVYGRWNKVGKTPTIRSTYTSYATDNECEPDFTILDEVEDWLNENIGEENWSPGSHAIEAHLGLWATIYFRNMEDAVWFQTVWG